MCFDYEYVSILRYIFPLHSVWVEPAATPNAPHTVVYYNSYNKAALQYVFLYVYKNMCTKDYFFSSSAADTEGILRYANLRMEGNSVFMARAGASHPDCA